MERDDDREDLRGEEPRPGDDAQTALEKSGSINERTGEQQGGVPTADGIAVGAPGAYIRPTGVGTGLPGQSLEAGDEAEQVLDIETKAQRARGEIQRG